MTAVIGLDIGGTKLAGGVLDPGARILERLEWPARAAEGVDVSLPLIYKMLGELLAAAPRHGSPAGIGICSPGPLNPKTGFVFNPPNMPGWTNIPLKDEVEKRFHLPCRVENDANGAGLGEAMFGAGRGYPIVFYSTLSTGIGSGLIFNGQVYHGKNGFAAEGGHVTIDRHEPACNCGSVGCIEALASGTSIARRAREALGAHPESKLISMAGSPDAITAEIVARAAAEGDPLASRLIEETGEMMGIWLGTVISLLDPDIIVLGGGVSRIGEPLFRKIRQTAPRRTINPFAGETPIVPARLGKDVGIIGAAAVILGALGIKA